MSWSVYIIKSCDESLYTGISTNVDRRFEEHCRGTRGAKFFNGRKPVEIVFREAHPDRSSASCREAEIKRMTRAQKQQLIACNN